MESRSAVAVRAAVGTPTAAAAPAAAPLVGTAPAASSAVAAPAAAPQAQQNGGTLTMAAGGDFHEQAVNQNADGLRLISLGCYCGPKLSIRALGRDAETLPFDWVRTRIDGLLHFIKNDFDLFFHYDTRQAVPGCGTKDKPMVMHRSFYHSFWHDDLTKEADVA